MQAEEITNKISGFTSEIMKLQVREEAEMLPVLRDFIKSHLDKLEGIQFSTGNIDDQYAIEKATDDGEDILLDVFQTWDESEKEELVFTDLEYDQLKEIFIHLKIILNQ